MLHCNRTYREAGVRDGGVGRGARREVQVNRIGIEKGKGKPWTKSGKV